MTVNRPMDGADDIDPEATVELEVPDFSDTAAVQSLDATASLPALIDADLLATTDTYLGLAQDDAAAHFTNKLHEVEERLSRQTDRLAELELELARERHAEQALKGELLLATQEAADLATQREALQTRVLQVEADYSALLGSQLQLSQQESQQSYLSREVASLRAANESQLEALRSVEGYRNLSRSLLDERDGQIAALEQDLVLREQAQVALEQKFLADMAALETQRGSEKAQVEQEAALYRREVKAAEKRAQKQAYELAKQHDARCADLEQQLAAMLAQREQQVGELTATLERQLAELRHETQRLASGHEAELAALAAEYDARLAAAVVAAAATAAAERDAQHRELAQQADALRQEAQVLVTRHAEQVAALAVEHEAHLADAQARQALALQESLLGVDARLEALIAERDVLAAAVRSDAEERVAHHVEQYTALEAQLTEQTADLERTLERVRQEAAEAAEQADRSLAQLLATQEALSEALRTAEAERDQLAKDWVSQARQLADLQGQLDERDGHLKRTQAEAHASAALLGNLQQSIDRLGREGVARPPRMLPSPGVVDEPMDTRSRLLVQEMGGMEVGYPLQQRTTIGRTPDNDIAIDTNFISRHHAVVLVSSRHTIIEDLKSTNGIRVNGRRVSRQLLHDGDLVTIGKSDFRYSLSPQSEAPPLP